MFKRTVWQTQGVFLLQEYASDVNCMFITSPFWSRHESANPKYTFFRIIFCLFQNRSPPPPPSFPGKKMDTVAAFNVRVSVFMLTARISRAGVEKTASSPSMASLALQSMPTARMICLAENWQTWGLVFIFLSHKLLRVMLLKMTLFLVRRIHTARA